MENPEEILHSLEEFSKMKPKDIPRELEEYLCYVAKTGNPIYQWQTIKSLFREKLLSVITEFYEACPAVDIPPCPNVEMFNYELMKNFILEKLDTFAAAPFTVQRICELLTSPRKEYNRIDKYMRALEKNILVVSTMEPGSGRRSTENGEGIVNGIESEHLTESGDANHDINVKEMDESPTRVRAARVLSLLLDNGDNGESQPKIDDQISVIQENFDGDQEKTDLPSSSNIVEPPEELIQQETIITCQNEEDSQPHYLAFDNDTLNSSNNEQHTEIQHQPPQEPQILTEENPVEKTEDSEKIENPNNEIITKVEDEKTSCESDAGSEEHLPQPPPEEPTTNEALPSVPCSDLDDKLSVKNVEKPSEELTVTESGLPQEETASFEDDNVEQNVGVIISEEKVKDEEKTENVESSSCTVKDDVAEVESKVEENDLDNKEKCNEVIVNDDDVSKNTDIPMEIDIVNEAEIDKQPSSTSEDTFI